MPYILYISTRNPEKDMTHWAEPSAPDQAQEARYRRAVLSGMSREEFEAAERAAEMSAEAAIDAKLAAAKAQGASDVGRWDAIYRAAVCAAAQAIQARDWSAKRQALAVAEQADANRQVVFAALFGRAKEVPAQYASLERAGRALTRAESSAALNIIAADRAAMRQQQQRRSR